MFDCPVCGHKKNIPQTNADRIRSMNDEELAEHLVDIGWDCNFCEEHLRLDNEPWMCGEKCDEKCSEHCLEWLKQPEVKELEEKANSLAEAYAEAEDFTLRFLKCCSKHHIKLVSIGQKTELIESAKNFPFGCGNSVFADGRGSNGWPAIWGVVEEMGISGGCGNTGQHQVSCDAKLIDGVYEFKDKKWRKIG